MTINWAKLVPELTVSDFETSLEFYKALGFELLFERPGFAYLEFEGVQWMIQCLENDDWQTASLEKPFGRGINFQIECKDATVIRNKLDARNYELFRDLKDSWYKTGEVLSGQREFLVQDPDGYLLRFAQSLGEKELAK
ncbi:MAG: VOC family protein [Trueperaceae bacterium]|nr:VOC family protein [Trueperaceae bacterium]